MAKKNFDSLLSNILGEDKKQTTTENTIAQPPVPVIEKGKKDTDPADEERKRTKPVRKTICTKMEVELYAKVQTVAEKEGIDIKDIMELGCQLIIDKYEEKHGKVRVSKKFYEKKNSKDVSDIFM